MPCSRHELEQREKLVLAPFAQFSADSMGRFHQEPPPVWRTEFQRDRDRIIHSRAFRRLEYKTQVFLNGTGDHLRTRLTHTMEVAAISRNIARALRLNEDLAEAIALAHDLGHPPFGHKGEGTLNKLMQSHGGFDHNRHSLRIVEVLEQKYPTFPGLNLSWEVREGLSKHSTAYDIPGASLEFPHLSPSLEAQVANLADEIAYYSHDLDDGLDSGLLQEKDLLKNVALWGQSARDVRRHHGKLPQETRWFFTIRCIIDAQVQDVVETTDAKLKRKRISSASEVRQQPRPLVSFSAARHKLNIQLRRYLYQNLYYSPEVHGPNLAAVNRLAQLFDHFITNPDQIGVQSSPESPSTDVHRSVCDYLAGMTDRYALNEHHRIFSNQLNTNPSNQGIQDSSSAQTPRRANRRSKN